MTDTSDTTTNSGTASPEHLVAAPFAALHPNAQAVARVLIEAGLSGEIVVLPEPAPSAATAAAQLGCPVGAIANSLIFDADGRPLLVLTSGAHRVDTAVVASLIGADQVRRASAEFVREHTSQPIGGVAPTGHPHPVQTLVDVDLDTYPTVWAAAGHPHTVFATTFAELVELTAGTAAIVAS